MQTCPICGKENLSPQTLQCPQCNADLTCFRVLEGMGEEKTKAGNQRKIFVLWVLVVVGLVLLLSWLGYMMVKVVRQNQQIAQAIADNQKMLREYREYRQPSRLEGESIKSLLGRLESGMSTSLKAVKEEIQELMSIVKAKDPGSSPPENRWPEFFFYETTDKDTLWDISERFYQHGRYYPVLLAMNPTVNIYEIKAEQWLKILKSQEEVTGIFSQYLQESDSGKYFYYQVQTGDTWESISKKFYKPIEQKPSLLQRINPGVRLAVGQRVMILLKEEKEHFL